MNEQRIDKGYIELFVVCRDYVCRELKWTANQLNNHVKKIIKTDSLLDFYERLQESTGPLATVEPITQEADFFYQIDHYDEYILEDTRDVTGSYYTPKEIVVHMCNNLLHSDFVKDKLGQTSTFSLLEPACGTMTFLRGLIQEMKNNEIEEAKIVSTITQMTAIDIQKEPLILGMLGMIYVSHRILGSSPLFSVYCGDTLKMVALYNSADVIFGNPPYLGEKGNGTFFRALKNAPETAPYYEGRMDLYYFFIHYGLNALKEKGLVSFITTNYFTTADSGKILRNRLRESGVFRQLTDYSGDGFFKSARGQHNLSFIYEKKVPSHLDLCRIDNVVQDKKGALTQLTHRTIHEYKLYDDKVQMSLSVDEAVYDLLEKIKEACTGHLMDKFDVKQGIVSGGDFVTNRILKLALEEQSTVDLAAQITKGDPIFVFPYSAAKPFEGPWQSFYKNSDIDAYFIEAEPRYMIYYVSEGCPPSSDGLDHLSRFEFVLSKRREVMLGYRAWYELQWPRTKDMFEQAKIVMPQRSKRNVFAYTDKAFYGSADIYYILHENQQVDDLLYLTGILNSKLYYFWLYHRGKKKGELLELYSTPIKNLPLIHYCGLSWQKKIVERVKTIIKERSRDNSEIDSNLYEGFSLSKSEIDLIESLYAK